MKIAICDDESIFRDRIIEYIVELQDKNLTHSILFEEFESGTSLVNHIVNEKTYFDIYLMDIVMPGLDGFQVSKKIREIDKNAIIIFLTSQSDFVYQGYEVEAFRYLMKPIKKEEFYRVMEAAFEKREGADDLFVLKTKDKYLKIPLQELMYFENQGRKIILHLKDKTHESYTFYHKIKDLEETLLGKHFIRTHVSYLVNEKYVMKYLPSSNQIALKNGTLIPVSRSYKDKISRLFKQGGSV